MSGNASRCERPSLSRRCRVGSTSQPRSREQNADLFREIEEEVAAQREATGKTVLGRAAMLKKQPHERPLRSKKSYAPLPHAVSRQVRRDLYDGYRASSPPSGKRRNGCATAIWPRSPSRELPTCLAVRRRLTTAGSAVRPISVDEVPSSWSEGERTASSGDSNEVRGAAKAKTATERPEDQPDRLIATLVL